MHSCTDARDRMKRQGSTAPMHGARPDDDALMGSNAGEGGETLSTQSEVHAPPSSRKSWSSSSTRSISSRSPPPRELPPRVPDPLPPDADRRPDLLAALA